ADLGIHQLPAVEQDDADVGVVGVDGRLPALRPDRAVRVQAVRRTHGQDVHLERDTAALDGPVVDDYARVRRQVRADRPGDGVPEDVDARRPAQDPARWPRLRRYQAWRNRL